MSVTCAHAAARAASALAAAGANAGDRKMFRASARRAAPRRGAARVAAVTAEAVVDVSTVEDKWIAGSLERCAPASGVAALRDAALANLAHARMPTQRVEEYRFTDLAPLVTAKPSAAADPADADIDASAWTLKSADASRVVLVDGVFRADLSDLSGVGSAVRVGTLSSGEAAPALGTVSSQRGGVIADLNAVMASDAVVLDVPAGARLETPLHVVQLSTGAGGDAMSASAPRVVVTLGDGAEATVVEDFAAAPGSVGEGAYWHNGVCEMVLGKGAKLTHAMVQAQSRSAVHTRATYLTQAEESEYKLAEINVGGKIGRHDLGITQLGPRTNTELACFNLAGAGQCLDLHSSVTLDHEEGATDQVHKCIVSAASGRGVFDGNVQVNKMAQRTDAGQISRNLLLVPKATVNVKPNLQIVADDVVCTHGCTVSDLEEEELFYIQSRGLSPTTARSLLVAGFGLEIVSKLEHEDLRTRVSGVVRNALDEDDIVLAV